ncbi:MAG: hypothetical protein EBR79_02425, partial [Proteobacteria bacterium]|nr:hypothetical protein [Pseudomonadota bacterium]
MGFITRVARAWRHPRRALAHARNWLILQRQKHLNRLFSLLYGQPMQLVPAGHVSLAGAVVLWCVHNGQRQLLMLRSPLAADTRLRFVSSMGLGQQGDAASHMRAAIEQQLGRTFARSTQITKHIATNRLVAAPAYTYANPQLGVLTPMQVLVWQVHIQPVQVELAHPPKGLEIALVPESLLTGNSTT